MKRIAGLFLAALLLVMTLPAALGAGINGEITIGIDADGSGHSVNGAYPVVQIELNGVLLDSDVPAFAWNNRTMVPIRALTEAMGAEVEWIDGTNDVSITMGSRTVMLRIGSAQAWVNGQATTTYDSVPAVLVTYKGINRTMVPVRFVTEQLGAKVEWIEEIWTAAISTPSTPTEPSYQVTDIETDADAGTVHITTSETPEYVVTDLGGRVVVDILGAALSSGSGGTIEMDSGGVYRVRYAQHDSNLYAAYANTVRVVLDVKAGVTYQKNMTLEVQDNGLLLTTVYVPVQPGTKTIVLDAGHGGTDPGAIYGGVNEKDINLAVTKKVEALLLEHGYNVIMTRSTDVYVGLYDRAAIANEAQADIFVALHSNAAPGSPTFTGAYTYYYYSSEKGIQLAKSIQAALCEATGAIDRGVISSQNLVVLRETNMPAVLVEMGFMTSPEELENLTAPAYQDKLAAGIVEGIIRYFDEA